MDALSLAKTHFHAKGFTNKKDETEHKRGLSLKVISTKNNLYSYRPPLYNQSSSNTQENLINNYNVQFDICAGFHGGKKVPH